MNRWTLPRRPLGVGPAGGRRVGVAGTGREADAAASGDQSAARDRVARDGPAPPSVVARGRRVESTELFAVGRGSAGGPLPPPAWSTPLSKPADERLATSSGPDGVERLTATGPVRALSPGSARERLSRSGPRCVISPSAEAQIRPPGSAAPPPDPTPSESCRAVLSSAKAPAWVSSACQASERRNASTGGRLANPLPSAEGTLESPGKIAACPGRTAERGAESTGGRDGLLPRPARVSVGPPAAAGDRRTMSAGGRDEAIRRPAGLSVDPPASAGRERRTLSGRAGCASPSPGDVAAESAASAAVVRGFAGERRTTSARGLGSCPGPGDIPAGSPASAAARGRAGDWGRASRWERGSPFRPADVRVGSPASDATSTSS